MPLCKVSCCKWDFGPMITVRSPTGTELCFPVESNQLSLEMKQLVKRIQSKSWSVWPIHDMSIEIDLMREMLNLEIRTVYNLKGE